MTDPLCFASLACVQLGTVVALGHAAPWTVSVTLDDDEDITVDEEFAGENLDIVKEVACVVCRGCLPEEEVTTPCQGARESIRSRESLYARCDADRPARCAQESDDDSELLRCQDCDVRIHRDVSRPPRFPHSPRASAENSGSRRAVLPHRP